MRKENDIARKGGNKLMMKKIYDQPFLEFLEISEKSIFCVSYEDPILDENETPFLIFT